MSVPANLYAQAPANRNVEIEGQSHIVDGDTAVISSKGYLITVRFAAIDTPEKKQLCQKPSGACYPCGAEATKYLASIVNYEVGSRVLSSDKVRCELVAGQVTYGRKVGGCFHDGLNLNIEMVLATWTVASKPYLKYVPDLIKQLVVADKDAKKAGRGIWQGKFIEPW